MRGRFLLAGAVVLAFAGLVPAQESDLQDELRFVQALRGEHYYDLALDYITRLEKKGVPPDVAGDLALERLQIRFDRVGDEPDTAKRRQLYGQLRTELQDFLAKNPGSRRAGDAKLTLANVTRREARAQYSLALASGSTQEADRARALLEDSGKQLQTLAKDLDGQLGKAADPKEKQRLALARGQAYLDYGVNLVEQALTFDESKEAQRKIRGARLTAAQDVFKVLGAETNLGAGWQAQAWLAYCTNELGEPKAGYEQLDAILAVRRGEAVAGQRLARYFRLLILTDPNVVGNRDFEPTVAAVKDEAAKRAALNLIIDRETAFWLKAYPSFVNTPEGSGIRWLRAEMLLSRSETAPEPEKTKLLAEARKLYADLEQGDSEFADRAAGRRLVIIEKQGGFKKKPSELTTFEDCFVRARYEIHQLGEEAKTVKDPKELEARRAERLDTVLAVLQRGLTLPDAKATKNAVDAANARSMIAYYLLVTAGDKPEKLREAATAGEKFVREEPGATTPVENAALYALEAYTRLAVGKPADDTDRKKFTDFADYVAKRWPDGHPSNLARHRLAQVLLADKTVGQDERTANVMKAIDYLSAITPAYPAYALVRYQVAEQCLLADREKYPVQKGVEWRKRAVEALRSIPEAVGEDPDLNRVVFLSRLMICDELFRDKAYPEMEAIALKWAPQVDKVSFGVDKADDEKAKTFFRTQFRFKQLLGVYGLAEGEISAGKYADAAKRLDPVVNDIKAGKLPELKDNPKLAEVLLNMSLKADVQTAQLAQARNVVQAMVDFQTERQVAEGEKDRARATELGALTVLRSQVLPLMRAQIRELTDKGDMAALTAAQAGWSTILDDLAGRRKSPNPEFTLWQAQGRIALGQVQQAADLLAKEPDPKPGAKPDDPDPALKWYHACRLLYVQQLRHLKNFKPAYEEIEQIIGTKEKPGWGRSDLSALLERVSVCADEGTQESLYKGARFSEELVKALAKRESEGGRLKEAYLESYYQMIYCYMKYAQGLQDPAKRTRGMQDAAKMMVQFEKDKGPMFGSEVSAKRFADLLAAQPEFKAEYEKAKAAAK